MEDSVSLAEPIEYLFLHTILQDLNRDIMKLEKFSLASMSFLHSYFQFCTCLMHHRSNHLTGDADLSGEDMEMVMASTTSRRTWSLMSSLLCSNRKNRTQEKWEAA